MKKSRTEEKHYHTAGSQDINVTQDINVAWHLRIIPLVHQFSHFLKYPFYHFSFHKSTVPPPLSAIMTWVSISMRSVHIEYSVHCIPEMCAILCASQILLKRLRK